MEKDHEKTLNPKKVIACLAILICSYIYIHINT